VWVIEEYYNCFYFSSSSVVTNISIQTLNLKYIILFFSGQLRIPSHISVLHVEQEVVGDDTPAIDSVLECDTKRQNLLNREKTITQAINNG
jgi:hypothetical protein